ncbi:MULTISPECIES: lecithin retinol acyltransferase family protein [Myxococcus]|nr:MULTISPECIES: lecithin retinol acyltransferase family protein [Myxococcus]NOJ54344.1 lecithin retinol acyltransferase family protein [Myxococcus xanthus]QPM78534.1 lecithin retinol acyltransferase family protein [Myxococcus xanthus]QVW67602.1 lecithin retinol acyltransferase family protein [Myxococcus xanthus DZ2]QZZ53774.1 hypothetical protein MyxoNM_31590 [Myxococcus xanthus]UEO06271.1 lecithin retinol acyltransferase family protein [Myxococcus xanthus DZ2]
MARADHIKVARSTFWHHGIDLGDGSVVHFTGFEGGRKSTGCIRRTLLRDFIGKGKSEVVDYTTPVHVVDHTCLIALGMLRKGGYSLSFNNCEHFATYCKTGKHESQQVAESIQRIQFFTRGAVCNPAFLIAGPLAELIWRGGRAGAFHFRRFVRRLKEEAKEAAEAIEIGEVSWTFFRLMRTFVDAGGQHFVLHTSGQWFSVGTAGELTPIEEPSEAQSLMYVSREWLAYPPKLDCGPVKVREDAGGWWLLDGSGSATHPLPAALALTSGAPPAPWLGHAPLGALNAQLEAPDSLGEIQAAVAEVHRRGTGTWLTRHLLREVAEQEASGFPEQIRPAWQQIRLLAALSLNQIREPVPREGDTPTVVFLSRTGSMVRMRFDQADRADEPSGSGDSSSQR